MISNQALKGDWKALLNQMTDIDNNRSAVCFPGRLTGRIPQMILIGTFIPFCWLAMQVVHELGHVFVAWMTKAEVTKVAFHPLIFSRTDLAENPHPLAVVWGGPLFGSLLPLLAFGVASISRLPGVYLFRFFAGFCLVANGVYIGTGWLIANGADPGVMLENGSPTWFPLACTYGTARGVTLALPKRTGT
jgi:hypothetical protein